MSNRSPRLRVVQVKFVRGPPTAAWIQLMRRLLANPTAKEPAATRPEPRRAKEATNESATSV